MNLEMFNGLCVGITTILGEVFVGLQRIIAKNQLLFVRGMIM